MAYWYNFLNRSRVFYWAIASIILAYALVQVVYVIRIHFVMDEFQYACTIKKWLTQVPYRDVSPPKTVLGMYLQMLPLFFAEKTWPALILIRLEMVFLNVLFLGATVFGLRRFFRRDAIVFSLAILICSSTFLERSFAIRTDLLAAWLALLGLLLLLKPRYVWAGIFYGLSFFVSQKSVYFILSADIALFCWWAIFSRNRQSFAHLLVFNIAILGVVLAYMIFWSVMASPANAFKGVFVHNIHFAVRELYHIPFFWPQSIGRNPLIYALGLLALAHFPIWRLRGEHKRIPFLLFASGIVTAFLYARHLQPWPYFIVTLFPTLFALNTAILDHFFDQAEKWISGEHRILNRLLPSIPAKKRSPLVVAVVLAFMLGLGTALPLVTRVPKSLKRDSSFQRANVELAERLVKGDSSYLAGMDMVLGARQVLPELTWLDSPQLARINDLPANRIDEIIRRLEMSDLKFVISNYRIANLCNPIKNWLKANYTHLWGNIWIYSPTIAASTLAIALKFDGTYQVLGTTKSLRLSIDGLTRSLGETFKLSRGNHVVRALGEARLRLLPPREVFEGTERRFDKSQSLFPFIYTW